MRQGRGYALAGGVRYSPKPSVFTQTFSIHPNLQYSPKPSVFTQRALFTTALETGLETGIVEKLPPYCTSTHFYQICA